MIRKGRHASVAQVVWLACSAVFAQNSPSSDTIRFRQLSEHRLPATATQLGGVVERGLDGQVYFLSVEHSVVHRFGAAGSFQRIQLETTPESATADVTLMQDIAVDSTGRLFVPAIWRYQQKGGAAGIFLFDASGHYLRTILLLHRTNVRHIALAPDGDLFVLGVDPDYFLHRTASCFLIHKYTQMGNRMTAFSPCPADATRDRQASGSSWAHLNFEVDRGSIWIKEGHLYQLMPASRTVRIFDLASGQWTRETTLEPPVDGGPVTVPGYQANGPVVWRLLPLANGQYLAQWISGSTDSPEGGRTSLTVHDASGSSRAHGAGAAWMSSVPLYSNEDGMVTFAAQGPAGEFHLVHGEISTGR